MHLEEPKARRVVTIRTGPGLAQIAIVCFVAAVLGGALGAAAVVIGLRADENARIVREQMTEDRLPRVDEEARRRAEERRAEEDAKRRADAEARRRADEDAKRSDMDRRRADEEARRREEARRSEEEERRREGERRRAEGTPGSTATGVTCDYSVPALRGAYATEADCYFVQRNFSFALSTARDGAAPSTWSNPRSGSSGSITILSTSQRADGTMCRQFRQTVTTDGKTVTGTGTACHRNNAWMIVS